jgi:hypothetical protein
MKALAFGRIPSDEEDDGWLCWWVYPSLRNPSFVFNRLIPKA